jgi:hypothetical protein
MSAQLHAIGPLDGRYRGRLESVSAHFSEYAYIKHRVEVEMEYFIALLRMNPPLPQLAALSPPSDNLVAKLQSVSSGHLSASKQVGMNRVHRRSTRISTMKMPSGSRRPSSRVVLREALPLLPTTTSRLWSTSSSTSSLRWSRFLASRA